MAKTQIAPAVEAYTAEVARAAEAKKQLDRNLACEYETGLVRRLSSLTDRIFAKAEELEKTLIELNKAADVIAESEMVRDTVLPAMNELRIPCDEAETLTSKEYWPFPSYGDLLFGVK